MKISTTLVQTYSSVIFTNSKLHIFQWLPFFQPSKEYEEVLINFTKLKPANTKGQIGYIDNAS
jgi:hypothetical protein